MKQLAALAVFACALTTAHATILIDDFTLGSSNTGYISSGNQVVNTAVANVYGGIRTTIVGVLNNPAGEDARVKVDASPNGGSLKFAAGPALEGLGQVGYGFTGSNPMNLNMNADRHVMILTFNDLPLFCRATIITGDSSLYQTTLLMAPGAGVHDLDFTSAGDLSDVDTLYLAFYNTDGGDFILNNVTAVPEPATMAVLGLGLIPLMRRNRKSKTQ